MTVGRRGVNNDKVAPFKEIKVRTDKTKLSLHKDTLATMEARNKARKSGNKNLYKLLRNKATKLVKRDQIHGVLNRLGKNPGPKSSSSYLSALGFYEFLTFSSLKYPV